MQRQKFFSNRKIERTKRKALELQSRTPPIHKEDLSELAAYVRGRRRKWFDWIPLALYVILGFVAFFFGIKHIKPSEDMQLSLGSALILKLTDSTGKVMSEAQFLPNEVSAANPLEVLGYGAISFGLALIAIGLSLIPKMHDRELDNLLTSMAISMSERLRPRPQKSEESNAEENPVNVLPPLAHSYSYDPYDPDRDTPKE
ncbi:hypothetical protein ACTXPA_07280 [Glutamicibacter arilaitensis]|uniref:hypothetical protein n=1 Tax=Glutamicibacter arilaitensis TaxID=256701 RepID=UPI003FD665EE